MYRHLDGLSRAPKRKIVFLTGTRADFGKLKPLIRAVDNNPNFECTIFATGMHMLRQYGHTIEEISVSGFKNVYAYVNQRANDPMDLALANTIEGFSRYVFEYRPDLIVVHGDRIEPLAGATVGALQNIRVAHIEGGERSGTIDDMLRHSISKLSHLHFVANNDAKVRLLQMGESESSIFVIGSPDLDVMSSDNLPSYDKVRERYELFSPDYDCGKFGIALYHPVTTEVEHQRDFASEFVSAILASQQPYVVVLPNNDHGSRDILEEYERFKDVPNIRVFPSMRFEYFLTLMKQAGFVIGNSSAGIREAPFLGIPTVNVGSRQANRFNHDTILNVNNDKAAILEKIRYVMTMPKHTPCTHFGDGNSAALFMQVLNSDAPWSVPVQKVFNDFARTGHEPKPRMEMVSG